MSKEIIDNIFKLTLLVCVIFFLVIFNSFVNNFRYHFMDKEEYVALFDSKTGSTYMLFTDEPPSKSWVKISPFEELENIPIKRKQK